MSMSMLSLRSVYLACILLCVAAYMLLAVDALHESLNFVVPPLKRKCFYQELVKDSPSHKVEAFIISGKVPSLVRMINRRRL